MTSPTDEADPYDDPFAEDIHDPVVFALNGTRMLHERAQSARQMFERHVESSGMSGNILAVSARELMKEPIAKLAVASLSAMMAAGRLPGLPEDALDAAVAEWSAAYSEALKILLEVERLSVFLLTPSGGSAPVEEPPMPEAHEWAAVSALVHQDMERWAEDVRGKKGKLLIAKPSPGTGKTRAMIKTALREQSLHQRVVMTVRTKDMLVGELEPRIRSSSSMVRLHVIQGRDESTCWNFDNVKAAQASGYAPGTAVCSKCDFHPDVARRTHTFLVCPYYRSRQSAQNDTATARFKMNDYPLILTTHAGYLSALESGGGRFGKFWPCDMLTVDEDPTDAFEPEVIIKSDQLVLPPLSNPQDRPAHAMAALMNGAIAQAEAERRAMEAQGFRANGKTSEIHNRLGSAYGGLALHALFERVAGGAVGQQHGLGSALRVFRDVSDGQPHLAAGALYGATTAAAVSLVVPPRGLFQIGEALFEEHAMLMQLRRISHEKVHGSKLPPFLTAAQVEHELRESKDFDPAYSVRLEYVKGEWRFVLQKFVNMLDQGTNIIYGDAYANVEHTRQVFDKPRSIAADPSYVDPVTTIDHIAYFPEGSLLARLKTKSNITYLNRDGWGYHTALAGAVLRRLSGLRVLIYLHSVLKTRVEKFLLDNQNFGMAEVALENWGGGRGKDQYGDFDAVVTISDYVQNIGGMLHKVNARAARDTARLLARGKTDEALAEGERIRFVLDETKTDIAHAMTQDGTHWRLKQEHERQNVNELAQALHRVRGLRSPKLMVVLGDSVPFTRDTIAASVTATLPSPEETPSGKPASRKKIKTWCEDVGGVSDGCMTADESYMGFCEIEERLGCVSPAFSHAFLDQDIGFLLDQIRLVRSFGGMCEETRFAQDVLYGDLFLENVLSESRFLTLPWQSATPGVVAGQVSGWPVPMPGDHPRATLPIAGRSLGPPSRPLVPPATVPNQTACGVTSTLHLSRSLSLIDRVMTPPAEWINQYKRASQELKRVKLALARVSREFPFSGRYHPSWAGTGVNFAWYSRHSVKTGLRTFTDIMETQYGPNFDGVHHVPNRKPIVPF